MVSAVPDELEREGLVKKLPYDREKVMDAIGLAHRDLKTARSILDSDRDWAYTIAYNAVLQAGRALMFSKGFRPDGTNQHIAVVKFTALFLEKDDAAIFDRMRRKRHRSVYDTAGVISETEAGSAVEYAGILVRKIELLIRERP